MGARNRVAAMVAVRRRRCVLCCGVVERPLTPRLTLCVESQVKSPGGTTHGTVVVLFRSPAPWYVHSHSIPAHWRQPHAGPGRLSRSGARQLGDGCSLHGKRGRVQCVGPGEGGGAAEKGPRRRRQEGLDSDPGAAGVIGCEQVNFNNIRDDKHQALGLQTSSQHQTTTNNAGTLHNVNRICISVS